MSEQAIATIKKFLMRHLHTDPVIEAYVDAFVDFDMTAHYSDVKAALNGRSSLTLMQSLEGIVNFVETRLDFSSGPLESLSAEKKRSLNDDAPGMSQFKDAYRLLVGERLAGYLATHKNPVSRYIEAPILSWFSSTSVWPATAEYVYWQYQHFLERGECDEPLAGVIALPESHPCRHLMLMACEQLVRQYPREPGLSCEMRAEIYWCIAPQIAHFIVAGEGRLPQLTTTLKRSDYLYQQLNRQIKSELLKPASADMPRPSRMARANQFFAQLSEPEWTQCQKHLTQ